MVAGGLIAAVVLNVSYFIKGKVKVFAAPPPTSSLHRPGGGEMLGSLVLIGKGSSEASFHIRRIFLRASYYFNNDFCCCYFYDCYSIKANLIN